MKSWYKRPLTKGILLVAANITAIIIVTSLFITAIYVGNLSNGDLLNAAGQPYEDSEGMETLMHMATAEVLNQQELSTKFETEGKYDPNKLVDIIEYTEKGTISGKNNSGLAYRLEDLRTWGKAMETDLDSAFMEGNVVVCQKPDQTYAYYYMKEFKRLVADGKLKVELKGDASTEEFLAGLENGAYAEGYFAGLTIKNEAGESIYGDCWTLNEVLNEKVAPEGASNLLEVVNKTPELNGKLSKVYSQLSSGVPQIYRELQQYSYNSNDTWSEGNTNFSYLYADKNTKKVYTNRKAYGDFEKLEESLASMKTAGRYLVVMPKLRDFVSNMDVSAKHWRELVSGYGHSKDADYIYVAALDTSLPIQDKFYDDAQQYEAYAPYLRVAVYGGGVSLILFLCILIWLTAVAGRSGRDGKLHLLAFDRIKTEIGAVLAIALGSIPFWMAPAVVSGGLGYTSVEYAGNETYYMEDYVQSTVDTANVLSVETMFMLACITVVAVLVFFFAYLSLVRRIKAKSLWENSISRIFCKFFYELWSHRGLIWKTVVLLSLFLVIHWIAIGSYGMGGFWVVVALAEVAAGYYLLKNVIAKERIQKGIREIAAGNVDYMVSTKGLIGENLVMAEAVNHVGDGLHHALEESMRSERLKTDLITNVSHDIKTPLTSIINYVDLLKRENFTDPKIQGYLGILEAKAQRLKSLTEDVVEASKVSSGNISLECMDINLVELVNQTNGEFEGKLVAKSLEVVLNIPEEPAMVHVDGKRMWRILENIYGNAAKYAMPGTRVYVALQLQDEKVIFSLKNISAQPLNISADELTERFIRGDISRSTEGSGLGLSIAKSLTELQGGVLVLYLDGDLFKVTVEFPRVYPHS